MNNTDGGEEIAKAYDRYAHRVYGYSLRSCAPADAEDVVSAVFTIAWRRRADLPEEPLPWLLTTARNVISDRRRAERRRNRLVEQRSARVVHDEPTDEIVIKRQAMLAALAQLTEREREALLMVAWDGLTAEQAALVAGCSQRAFRARLARARGRLNAAIHTEAVQASPDELLAAEGIPT